MTARLAIVFALALLPAAAGGPRPDANSAAVADTLIGTPPESYPFNWGEGVQMIGLYKTFEQTGNSQYADYLERWAALFGSKGPQELLGLNLASGRSGYCGRWSPATALLYLYQARPRPEYIRMARTVLDYIRAGAERGPEGGLGHWQGSHQLWVDTLYMACPVLAGFARLDGTAALRDDAAQQIIVYARHLQDARAGLFYHMWDWQTKERTAGLWGRGNGWVLMSLADTMDGMERRHQSYAALRDIALRMARGLEAAQDRDGLWHTVMDDASSYPESSATSMCAYGLLKLIRLKVLPPRYQKVAMRAWDGVNARYVKDGVVTGVSAGTDPRRREAYGTIRVGSETWGTGAYLMAASEVRRAR